MSTEKTAAAALIAKALELGYLVSVNDGGEWTVIRSNDAKAINSALGTSGEDIVRFEHNGRKVGTAMLIWGNAADGSELAADYTDNAEMAALVAVMPECR